jgi:hypothetical protein
LEALVVGKAIVCATKAYRTCIAFFRTDSVVSPSVLVHVCPYVISAGSLNLCISSRIKYLTVTYGMSDILFRKYGFGDSVRKWM